MAQHIFTGTTPPAFIPSGVGQHYVDTSAKKNYISVGTTSSSDWKLAQDEETYISNPSIARTAPDDLAPVYDTSALEYKKLTLQKLLTARGGISDQGYFWSSDFVITDTNILVAAGSGAGNSTQQGTYGMNNIERALGISETDTGTTSTGRRTVSSGLNILTTGLARLRVGMRHAINQLSTVGETFTVYLGFINNAGSGNPLAGAFFRYTNGVNSGRYEAVTASGSGSPTYTTVNTGVLADTNYHIFEVEINETADEVNYYIDGNLVAIITTDIPPLDTTVNFTFGFGWKIEKSVGTTSVAHSVDWAYLETERSTPR